MEKEKTIFKNALVSQISSKSFVDVKSVNKVLDTLQQVILENINEGFEIKLNGFLMFNIVRLAQRVGVDKETGKKIQLPAQKRINIKVSDSFQKKILQ